MRNSHYLPILHSDLSVGKNGKNLRNSKNREISPVSARKSTQKTIFVIFCVNLLKYPLIFRKLGHFGLFTGLLEAKNDQILPKIANFWPKMAKKWKSRKKPQPSTIQEVKIHLETPFPWSVVDALRCGVHISSFLTRGGARELASDTILKKFMIPPGRVLGGN